MPMECIVWLYQHLFILSFFLFLFFKALFFLSRWFFHLRRCNLTIVLVRLFFFFFAACRYCNEVSFSLFHLSIVKWYEHLHQHHACSISLYFIKICSSSSSFSFSFSFVVGDSLRPNLFSLLSFVFRECELPLAEWCVCVWCNVVCCGARSNQGRFLNENGTIVIPLRVIKHTHTPGSFLSLTFSIMV